MTLEELNEKNLLDLREMAKDMQIPSAYRYKKADLVKKIKK